MHNTHENNLQFYISFLKNITTTLDQIFGDVICEEDNCQLIISAEFLLADILNGASK